MIRKALPIRPVKPGLPPSAGARLYSNQSGRRVVVSRRPAQWEMRYQPEEGRRDERVDLLRGFCILLMVFVHSWWTPLHRLYDWRGYWTAAEGFFFISGAVVGIVYRHRIAVEGLAASTLRLWRRAATLYLSNLFVVVLWFGLDAVKLGRGERLRAVWGEDPAWYGLLHLDQPYFLHVLPRYTVFLLFASLALRWLEEGRTGRLMAAVWSLYLLALWRYPDPSLPWVEPRQTWFPVIAWQLLFMLGLAAGYHRRRVAAVWHRLGGPATALLAATLTGGFVALRLGLFGGELAGGGPAASFWLGREHLGPLRLVNLAAVFTVSFFLVDRCWQPLRRSVGCLLLPFGRNALYVFLLHMIVLMAVHPFPFSSFPLFASPWMLLLPDAALIAAIWWAVQRRFLFRVIPR